MEGWGVWRILNEFYGIWEHDEGNVEGVISADYFPIEFPFVAASEYLC